MAVLQEAYRSYCVCEQEKEPKQPDLRLEGKGKKKRPRKGEGKSRQVFKAGYKQVQDDRKEVHKKDRFKVSVQSLQEDAHPEAGIQSEETGV